MGPIDSKVQYKLRSVPFWEPNLSGFRKTCCTHRVSQNILVRAVVDTSEPCSAACNRGDRANAPLKSCLNKCRERRQNKNHAGQDLKCAWEYIRISSQRATLVAASAVVFKAASTPNTSKPTKFRLLRHSCGCDGSPPQLAQSNN